MESTDTLCTVHKETSTWLAAYKFSCTSAHSSYAYALSGSLSLSLALGLNSYLYVLFFSEIQQIRSLLSESSDIWTTGEPPYLDDDILCPHLESTL